jgi:HPt (histidine-containing phosphotransfer) domain-containing protein
LTHEAFDRARALAALNGDEDLLQRIAALFVSDHAEQLNALLQAWSARDIDRLHSVAHSLKGAATTFGAGPAADAALAVERCCRSRDLARAEPDVLRLRTEILRLVGALVAEGLANAPPA